MGWGDHLRVQRFSGYWHHGIDVGANQVVHFSGSIRNVSIGITSLEAFRKRGTPEVVPYSRCDPPERVVERALSRVGERGYNLLSNNCEHFARWCKTGLRPEPRGLVGAGTTLATLGLVAVVLTVVTRVG